jgi:hypothetical protein
MRELVPASGSAQLHTVTKSLLQPPPEGLLSGAHHCRAAVARVDAAVLFLHNSGSHRQQPTPCNASFTSKRVLDAIIVVMLQHCHVL